MEENEKYIVRAKHNRFHPRRKSVWYTYGFFATAKEAQEWASWKGITHYQIDFADRNSQPIVVTKYCELS